MWFGGFQPFTLSDYPGHVAAIAFTQGCNFRCPFCHNGTLIPHASQCTDLLSVSVLLEGLAARRGKLEGLVVSGGEPTVHAQLPAFLRAVKALGYAIKLDTNGSNPEMLSELIAAALVDYIAMDVKAPLKGYDRLCGVPAPVAAIQASIAVIARSRQPHHFRTTAVTPLLSAEDMGEIAAMIPVGSKYVIQPYNSKNAYAPALRDAPVVDVAPSGN